MAACEKPQTRDEAQARARLAQRLEPHGLAVDESFRGDALIAAAEIFGLDPAPGNEPLDRAAGPDLHHNRSCHGNS